MIADVCGSTSRLAKVAPPLKSTRTKFSVSDEWVIARPSTSVRSSSDLPEPVAPMTRPCGPMPPCADSLMSSSTGCPPAPTPIGTRSRSRGARGRQLIAGSSVRGSPMPQQVGQAEVHRQRVGRLRCLAWRRRSGLIRRASGLGGREAELRPARRGATRCSSPDWSRRTSVRELSKTSSSGCARATGSSRSSR